MDQNLHGLFERALSGEPVPPRGDPAAEAMARGTRLRRRRHLLAGGAAAGVIAVFATMVALNATASTSGTAPPVTAAAAMRLPVEAGCTTPEHRRATDVSIFLSRDITERQRLDLDTRLRADPLVRGVAFESREEAYAKFAATYQDSPDLVKAVRADQMPEAFRVQLAEPSRYPAFVAELKDARGIEEIVGSTCRRQGSPSGEGE